MIETLTLYGVIINNKDYNITKTEDWSECERCEM